MTSKSHGNSLRAKVLVCGRKNQSRRQKVSNKPVECESATVRDGSCQDLIELSSSRSNADCVQTGGETSMNIG